MSLHASKERAAPLLAFDTSTLMASVAIVDGDRVLSQRQEPVHEGHGESLMPLVQAVCAEAHVRPAALAGIAVGIGPGTFTGLRVGLATAKGIAVGHYLPVVGVSSLAALARHASHDASPECVVVPMLDARRGEIYTAAFAVDGATLLDERAVPAEQFAQDLLALQRPCLCCGEGFVRYRAAIENVLKARCLPASADRHVPNAVAIAALARDRLQRGDSDDLYQLTPRYVRATYAEPKM